MKLNVNGKSVSVDVEEGTPLLWVLREHLGLTGTKYGCGVAQCGACTVHLDGMATRSCAIPVEAVGQQQVLTIEALGGDELNVVQQVWAELDIPQCGYCQVGMIMAASSLIAQNPNPTEDDIRSEITNICRCGTYTRVLAGVKLAAERSANRG